MKKIFLGLIVLIVYSCISGRITTTETKLNETIVFGKLIIESERALVNNKILVHFNERLWAKNAVWLDENGYFYMKMPLGKNFIALIEDRTGNYYKNIPDNYISIDVPLADKVYYIGDITLLWTPSDADKRINGGVAVALNEAYKKGENINVKVAVSESTVSYFQKLFTNNNKEIITSLTRILDNSAAIDVNL